MQYVIVNVWQSVVVLYVVINLISYPLVIMLKPLNDIDKLAVLHEVT